MTRLSITYDGSYEYDEWLEIALTGTFSGTAGLYAKPDVLAEFAQQLSAYPIDPDHPPKFEDNNILIQVEPDGQLGKLWMSIQLAEFYERADLVRCRVPMTYAGIQDFQRALQRFIEVPTSPLEIELR